MEMRALCKYKGFRFLLTVIDVFIKYARYVPLVDKTGQAITDAFKSITKMCKPQKLWLDKGTEFYNRTFRKWLDEKCIELYRTLNEGKRWSSSDFTEL